MPLPVMTGQNQGRCNERAKGSTHRRYTHLAELQLDLQYINCSKCFAMRIVPGFIMSTLQYPTDSCVAKFTLNGAHWADWDTCPRLPATRASKRSISGEERPTKEPSWSCGPGCDSPGQAHADKR